MLDIKVPKQQLPKAPKARNAKKDAKPWGDDIIQRRPDWNSSAVVAEKKVKVGAGDILRIQSEEKKKASGRP